VQPPASLSGFVFTVLRVIGSTVVGRHSAVMVGGEGGVGGLGDFNADEAGERVEDAEAFGAPGIVFRPRPPSQHDGDELAAEALAGRLSGRDVPVAWRDLRLNRNYPAPKAGSVALVGYGGGFLSFEDTSSLESVATLYVKYGSKAHAFVLDPAQESIMVIHGDGLAITMDPDNGITLRADATTYATLAPGKFFVQASSIGLQGNVALGANTTTATPLTAGPVAPTRPSVFLSVV
jgi:hypothetical protein